MLLPPTQGEQPHPCSQTHSSGRPGYLLLSVCWRDTEKNTIPGSIILNSVKRLWFGGISVAQHIKLANGRDHPGCWVDGGSERRRVISTRSVLLSALTWNKGSNPVFQRMASHPPPTCMDTGSHRQQLRPLRLSQPFWCQHKH